MLREGVQQACLIDCLFDSSAPEGPDLLVLCRWSIRHNLPLRRRFRESIACTQLGICVTASQPKDNVIMKSNSVPCKARSTSVLGPDRTEIGLIN